MKKNLPLLTIIPRFGMMVITSMLFGSDVDAMLPKQKTESICFSILEKLEQSQPLSKSQVENILSSSLQLDQNGGNPLFDFFQGQSQNSIVSHVAFRTAKTATPRAGGLLELEINAKKECITQKDILSRFGQIHHMNLPSPHAKTPMPLYWVYQRAWGTLSFGFTSTSKDCVTSLILDSIKKP